jgi:hypothetical protein
MKDKIIEILQRNLQLDMPNPEEAERNTAEEINAAFEQNLREELINYDKWLTRRNWGIEVVMTIEDAVDEYLKTRKK